MRFRLLIIFTIALFSCQPEKAVVIHGRTMGTTYSISLMDTETLGIKPIAIQAKIDSLLHEINQKMSTYIQNSEISRFNTHESKIPFTVSPEFVTVLNTALQVYRDSNGAFDVTVGPLVNLWGFGSENSNNLRPTNRQIESTLSYVGSKFISVINDTTIQKSNPQISLDFGAIAKGYGVDAVTKLLLKEGLKNFLVEIGGEISVKGKKNGKSWRIGIDRPIQDAQPGANLHSIIELSDVAMATSGDYRNYFNIGDSTFSHEIDPRTGQSIVTGVASVTVLAPSCMLADALATAVMVMGVEKGLILIESKLDVEALFILHDGKDFTEIASSNFR